MDLAELITTLTAEKAKPLRLQNKNLIDSYEFKITRRLLKEDRKNRDPPTQQSPPRSPPQQSPPQQARLSHRQRTLKIDGCDIIVIEFLSGSRTIGWATNTSCSDGPLPTTLESLIPNGALCFLIALYMNNLQIFQQRYATPCALVEFLRRYMPAEISHGQFEAKSFPSVAGLLDVQIEVRTNRPDIVPNTTYGNGMVLRPVTLDITNGHYVVPGIDAPLDSTPPQKQVIDTQPVEKACPTCTFVNSANSPNCVMCGKKFQLMPSVPKVCPACTFENTVDATNCAVCGEGFNGCCPITQLG